jgi:hypothetical protein
MFFSSLRFRWAFLLTGYVLLVSTLFPCLCVCNLVFLCTPLHVFWDPKFFLPFSSFLFARVGMWWLRHNHHHPSFFKLRLQMDTFVLCLCSSCLHVFHMFMCVVLCFYAHLCMFFGPLDFCSLFVLSFLQGWEHDGCNKSAITQIFSSSSFKWAFPPHVYALFVSMFFLCLCVLCFYVCLSCVF